jgi:hypothetical protein
VFEAEFCQGSLYSVGCREQAIRYRQLRASLFFADLSLTRKTFLLEKGVTNVADRRYQNLKLVRPIQRMGDDFNTRG